MNFYFLYPSYLYLLLIVPILILIYFVGSGTSKKRAINFSNFEALQRISGIEFFSKSLFVLFVDILLVIALVFALAQMQVSYPARTDSFAHVILIDSSGSMNVGDVGSSRLDLAKKIASSFVSEMPDGVEFGVVSFAGDVKVLKELDSSVISTKSAISSVQKSEIEGTNLLNAIITSDSLFRDQKKSILLISDGQFSFSNLSDVLGYLEENDIVVNSVIVGTLDGGRDNFGVLHKINLDLMKALSFNTKGISFEANTQDFEASFESSFVGVDREISLDLTPYLLLLVLILFILSWLLVNFRIFVF